MIDRYRSLSSLTKKKRIIKFKIVASLCSHFKSMIIAAIMTKSLKVGEKINVKIEQVESSHASSPMAP